jgi:glutaredoxin
VTPAFSDADADLLRYGPIAPAADNCPVATPHKAVIHRMVTPDHVCPYGEKAVALLRENGIEVEDHWLRTRAETDAYMKEQGVETTPQIFLDGERVGGYDDLQARLKH